MKIYVSHPKNFDYKRELYEPLKNAHLPVEFIFPHENSSESFNSRELFEKHGCDYVLGEVSYPATGQGIELGWADVFEIPILCFYKSGTKPAGSLKVITNTIVEYDNLTDLINKFAKQFGFNIA